MAVYRSTERVYTLDAKGDPYSLLYAVGDEIPEDEARRQGLLEEPKARASVPNKARTRVPNKARTTKET
jgi:hypothetical protein